MRSNGTWVPVANTNTTGRFDLAIVCRISTMVPLCKSKSPNRTNKSPVLFGLFGLTSLNEKIDKDTVLFEITLFEIDSQHAISK